MKTIVFIMCMISGLMVYAEPGYKVGDVVSSDFRLKNTDGKMISLADYPGAKGFIVVFTCNTCPYAKAYQDRLVTLDKEFKAQGFPVIAINPNNPAVVPDESYANMIEVAKEKKFTFPYLYDEKHQVFRDFGATNTPHAFVLQKSAQGFVVKYIGAIDNNYMDAGNVSQPYVKNAVKALLKGQSPEPAMTKAIGCGIKSKS